MTEKPLADLIRDVECPRGKYHGEHKPGVDCRECGHWEQDAPREWPGKVQEAMAQVCVTADAVLHADPHDDVDEWDALYGALSTLRAAAGRGA